MFVAPHGGFIEPGTETLCREIAAEAFSFYAFVSNDNSGQFGKNHPHHISSHIFQTPTLNEMLSSHRTVCSIHCCLDSAQKVFIGGLNKDGGLAISASLRDFGFETEFLKNGRNCGAHPDNICNRGLSGGGVQLEISSGLMNRLVDKFELTEEGGKFVSAVRLSFEMEI